MNGATDVGVVATKIPRRSFHAIELEGKLPGTGCGSLSPWGAQDSPRGGSARFREGQIGLR